MAIGSVPRRSRSRPFGEGSAVSRSAGHSPPAGWRWPQDAAVEIAWFDRHDPALEPVLGGKNTSLGIMTMAGLPVPPGFAVTATAYRRALTETGLATTLARMVSDVDVDDLAALRAAAADARATITGTPMPAWLSDQL